MARGPRPSHPHASPIRLVLREAARRSSCSSKVKQLGLALHYIHDAKQKLPFSSNACSTTAGWGGVWSVPYRTWNVDTMPHMEMQGTYEQLDFTQHINNGTTNSPLLNNKRLPHQECPSNPYASGCKKKDGGGFSEMGNSPVACYGPCNGPQSCDGPGLDCAAGANSYCTVANSDWSNPGAANNPGMFGGRNSFQCRFSDVSDGLNSTIMISEHMGDLLTWGGAFSGNFQGVPTIMRINSPQIAYTNSGAYRNNLGAGSYHVGGAMFCMGDGAVAFLSDTIDFAIYNALGGKSDGIVAKVP